MARDLSDGITTQQWVPDSYLISIGSSLLLARSFLDGFGRVRILCIGPSLLLHCFAPLRLRTIWGSTGYRPTATLLVHSSLLLFNATFDEGPEARTIGQWTWTAFVHVSGHHAGRSEALVTAHLH